MAEIGLSGRAVTVARRYLTTFNFSAQVNPLTAPPEVLQAIPGLGPSDVARILSARETRGPLPRLGTASLWLIARDGPIYTLEAEAELDGGAVAAVQVRVAQKGLSFRGGLMLYEVMNTSIQF